MDQPPSYLCRLHVNGSSTTGPATIWVPRWTWALPSSTAGEASRAPSTTSWPRSTLRLGWIGSAHLMRVIRSPQASRDIIDVLRYTKERWGIHQAREYRGLLE